MIETCLYGWQPIRGPHSIIGEFVCNIVFGDPLALDKYAALGFFENGDLIAGVLFHNWHPESGVMEMTAGSTSKRWLNRRTLQQIMSLVFDGFKNQLAVMRVSERNQNMIRIARAYGFSGTYIPRLRGRDEGEFIFTLTDDDWRNGRFFKASIDR
ncbi:N-acetyltransferase [Brucella sp. 6810]|uniref:N-acetyltransferase n=1 Tax=Brucella sp. 6810 TaxID=2769351 RepID=UPI00165B94A8|nr:N-acetyltransferase [Brucella sp. 6810]QNQ62517.1 N-acetyltransferase [Brucella sp. 6810]